MLPDIEYVGCLPTLATPGLLQLGLDFKIVLSIELGFVDAVHKIILFDVVGSGEILADGGESNRSARNETGVSIDIILYAAIFAMNGFE